MRLACAVAKQSPDMSTQNGAVLSTPDGSTIRDTFACNTFPAGVQHLPERWERPAKYVEHAERNSIYFAARNGIATQGLSLVCGWAACADCARAIVQSGIKTLVTFPRVEEETAASRYESIRIADEMLAEAGVEIEFITEYVPMPALRRNGRLLDPA